MRFVSARLNQQLLGLCRKLATECTLFLNLLASRRHFELQKAKKQGCRLFDRVMAMVEMDRAKGKTQGKLESVVRRNKDEWLQRAKELSLAHEAGSTANPDVLQRVRKQVVDEVAEWVQGSINVCISECFSYYLQSLENYAKRRVQTLGDNSGGQAFVLVQALQAGATLLSAHSTFVRRLHRRDTELDGVWTQLRLMFGLHPGIALDGAWKQRQALHAIQVVEQNIEGAVCVHVVFFSWRLTFRFFVHTEIAAILTKLTIRDLRSARERFVKVMASIGAAAKLGKDMSPAEEAEVKDAVPQVTNKEARRTPSIVLTCSRSLHTPQVAHMHMFVRAMQHQIETDDKPVVVDVCKRAYSGHQGQYCTATVAGTRCGLWRNHNCAAGATTAPAPAPAAPSSEPRMARAASADAAIRSSPAVLAVKASLRRGTATDASASRSTQSLLPASVAARPLSTGSVSLASTGSGGSRADGTAPTGSALLVRMVQMLG